MVNLTLTLFATSRRYSPTFIDKLRIHVKGGNGGAGMMHLGGMGGRGGDVILVGSKDKRFSLKQLKDKYPTKRFLAETGGSSSRRSISGVPGRSIYVQIPHGVTVVDAQSGKKLGNVNGPGDKVQVARGGKGGDRFSDFLPRPGEKRSINLDLRLIADVAFVGFPNAGKSTLLNAISNATPEVADYPFTTLRPHIGIINYKDYRKISCADLPGLIEGAHINLGMGHKFLKHIERTKLLLFVVDLFGFSLYLNRGLRDAFENIQLLTKELELYNKELVSRPAMLVFNKIDKAGADEKLNVVLDKLGNWDEHVHTLPEEMIPQKQMNFLSTISISAKQGAHLTNLKTKLREAIDQTILNRENVPLISDGQNIPVETDGERFAIIENTRENLIL